jgi:hypothetical protein
VLDVRPGLGGLKSASATPKSHNLPWFTRFRESVNPVRQIGDEISRSTECCIASRIDISVDAMHRLLTSEQININHRA